MSDPTPTAPSGAPIAVPDPGAPGSLEAYIAELERALARERTLTGVSRDISETNDLQAILDSALARLAGVLRFGSGSIALFNDQNALEVRAQNLANGLETVQLNGPAGEAIAGWVAR